MVPTFTLISFKGCLIDLEEINSLSDMDLTIELEIFKQKESYLFLYDIHIFNKGKEIMLFDMHYRIYESEVLTDQHFKNCTLMIEPYLFHILGCFIKQNLNPGIDITNSIDLHILK